MFCIHFVCAQKSSYTFCMRKFSFTLGVFVVTRSVRRENAFGNFKIVSHFLPTSNARTLPANSTTFARNLPLLPSVGSLMALVQLPINGGTIESARKPRESSPLCRFPNCSLTCGELYLASSWTTFSIRSRNSHLPGDRRVLRHPIAISG